MSDFDPGQHISSELSQVKIIKHSFSMVSMEELLTFSLSYQRFFHSEVMTHRAASKNASSSRAIPTKRMLDTVRTNTAMPAFFGKNQKGMQAYKRNSELLTVPSHLLPALKQYRKLGLLQESDKEIGVPEHLLYPGDAWKFSALLSADMSEAFAEANYHKQISNRITEPYQNINVVLTVTLPHLKHILRLRDHEAAQPEFQVLARKMKTAVYESASKPLYEGEWHLPYIRTERIKGVLFYFDPATGKKLNLEDAIKKSVASCARVSYNKHDGHHATLIEDVGLFKRLVGSSPEHYSPTEHQATPDTRSCCSVVKSIFSDRKRYDNEQLHGNLPTWIQYRKMHEQGIEL